MCTESKTCQICGEDYINNYYEVHAEHSVKHRETLFKLQEERNRRPIPIFNHDPNNAPKVGLMVSIKEWLEIKEAVSEIQSVLDTVLKDLDKNPYYYWPASEINKRVGNPLDLLEDEVNSLLSKLNRML